MRPIAAAVVLMLAWHAHSIAADEVDFARDVRPILEKACQKCHGPEKQKGGLGFDRKEGLFRAGDSGKQAVAPGKPDESELIHRVETADADERMPPKSEPLSREQIAILRKWIEQGANWPDAPASRKTDRGEMVVTDEDRQHWSYRPLRSVDVPAVQDAAWSRTRGFLVWMAGAGIKGGVSHGETDEIGYRAAVDPVTVHDLHATMLHVLGVDHKRLTYLHNGRRYRLTDVAGNVLTKVLA